MERLDGVINKIGKKYKNKKCDGQKKYILNTILGIEMPQTELTSGSPLNNKFMSKLAMQTFVTGSLSKKKMKNSMDKKRRKACRDFKLK